MSLTHSSPIVYVYFILDAIIIGLNSTEVYMIWREKIGKTFSKLFLVNLSSSDLVVGICLTISDTIYFLLSRSLIKMKPDAVIIIFFLAESVVLFACLSSLSNLCTLTVDRLIGVCKPLKYRKMMTKRRALVMIVMSWLFSLTATVVTTTMYRIMNINIVLHVMLFGVGTGSIFLLVTYSIIFVTVRKQRQMFPRENQESRNKGSINEKTSVSTECEIKRRAVSKDSLDPFNAFSRMKKRMPAFKKQDLKLLRISTGILISFFACWWPVTVIHCSVTISQNIPFEQGVVITILMQLNSILNSVVYFKWRDRATRKDSVADLRRQSANTAITSVSQPLISNRSEYGKRSSDLGRMSVEWKSNGVVALAYPEERQTRDINNVHVVFASGESGK